MYLRRDCLGLRSKKAGKAEQRSRTAKKQKSREGKKQGKQRSKDLAGKSREAEKQKSWRDANKQRSREQKSREADTQEKIPKQKKHIKNKYNNPPFHFGASSISLSLSPNFWTDHDWPMTDFHMIKPLRRSTSCSSYSVSQVLPLADSMEPRPNQPQAMTCSNSSMPVMMITKLNRTDATWLKTAENRGEFAP